MELMQAVILGVIQGLTEFFPVSSSGHLVVFQQMMGLKEPVLLFDISVHMGTLAAIVIYYFNDIVRIFRTLIVSVTGWKAGPADRSPAAAADVNMAWMIVAGSVPTALIGAGLQMISDILFSSLLIVGASLILTGGILMGTRWVNQKSESSAAMSIRQALFIGTVQGLAVIPGISRSGSTISAGLFLGVKRETAIQFSFLLSVPAILGALVLQILTDASGTAGIVSPGVLTTGLVTSFLVGYAALSLLVKMVQKGHLYMFAPYCIMLGAVVVTVWMTGS